jgi:extradiol dioxygenase family protein
MLRALRALDDIILLCQDLERMKRFYQEVLGFPLFSEGDEWIDFQVGATRLALRTRGRSYDGPPPPESTASLQLAFQVTLAQVDRCFAELQQRGVDIIEPLSQYQRNLDMGQNLSWFRFDFLAAGSCCRTRQRTPDGES